MPSLHRESTDSLIVLQETILYVYTILSLYTQTYHIFKCLVCRLTQFKLTLLHMHVQHVPSEGTLGAQYLFRYVVSGEQHSYRSYNYLMFLIMIRSRGGGQWCSPQLWVCFLLPYLPPRCSRQFAAWIHHLHVWINAVCMITIIILSYNNGTVTYLILLPFLFLSPYSNRPGT